MKITTAACCLAALAMASLPIAALAQTKVETPAEKTARLAEEKKLGSLYVRCDGNPNNMPDAEMFARVIALSLVVGLLAPPAEAADPTKRLFGDKGVEACTRLIDGDRREENGFRRLPLILARAAHRIEAKDYVAAVTDVAQARTEAGGLNLMGNPYFQRSLGLSLDLLEAEALLRSGDAAGAREAGLRSTARMPYSFYAIVAARTATFANREPSEAELAFYRSAGKLVPPKMVEYAGRLEDAGRYAEAAKTREDIIVMSEAMTLQYPASFPYAAAAVSHALAGDWTKAAERAERTRANMAARDAAGKVEQDRPSVIEVLDLYEVLRLMHDGKIDDARRNFAARSQWTAPSFGSLLTVTTRLRQGAKPDQLFGSLTKSADALWEDRRQTVMASLLESDTNNRKLFSYILPYAKVGSFEGMSKAVWRTDKSRIISDKPMENSRYHTLFVMGDAMTQPDALLLHAALLAKARGFKGFLYFTLPNEPRAALVNFGNPGDPGMAETLWLDADAVIAELRTIIPSPQELAARRRVRR